MSLLGSQPVPSVPKVTPVPEQSELGPSMDMENAGQVDLQVLGLGRWPFPQQG